MRRVVGRFTPRTLQSFVRGIITVKVPFLADSVSNGQIANISKQVGDFVEEDEIICVIESEKVAIDVRSPKSGKLVKMVEEGLTLNVNDEIAVVDETASGALPLKDEAAAASARKMTPPPQPVIPKVASASPAIPPRPVIASASASSTRSVDRIRSVRISPIRAKIAQRLKSSQDTAAILSTFNEIDMTPLIAMRNKHKEIFEKRHGVRLGFMSPFLRASSIALLEMPIINASWNSQTMHVDYHNFVDISVAVATPTGLVVPVVRDVQSLKLAQIEEAIGSLGEKARTGKLSIPDMTGGTFTVSNGGAFGSYLGTPIVNPPQSAILGMHAIKKKPWVVNNEIVIRDIMAVALSYDHRLIDGRDAVLFLKRVRDLLEDPIRLLLEE